MFTSIKIAGAGRVNLLQCPQDRITAMVILVLCLCLSFPVQLFAHLDQNKEEAVPVLVGTKWLADNLENPDVIIIDARPSGDYSQAHIAGALNLPPVSTYHSRLSKRVVSQAWVQAMLGSLGVRRGSHIVVYGDALYMDASRTFWMLELYGHSRVSLLNGGITAWERAGQPVNRDVRLPVKTSYRSTIQPGRMATLLQMLLAVDNDKVAIVDVRKAVEYQGIESRASRSGHIPSALNIPKDLNLEVRQGVYYIKPVAALEKLYQGLDRFSRIILYCNGVRESSISYVALRLLGRNVSIYDGGWSEWGNNPELPIVSPMQ